MDNERAINPPFGVKPRWLNDEQRMQDLAETIARYANAGLMKEKAEVIAEWIDELWDINRRYTPERAELLINGVPVVPYSSDDVP